MIVTKKAEKMIQAATNEIIKTVMAYSLFYTSWFKLIYSKVRLSHCAKLSNFEVVSLGSPAIMQFENCLDP
jgi:hypothetical protein